MLTVDSSAFAGADYHENVQGTDRVFIMPMRPIAVDGGALDGTYVANPDIYAAEVFAELLTERGITVTSVTTGSAPEITDDNTSGVVYSAPVRELVDYMLTMSDNSLAEVLGHLVAAERGLVPDFDGSARGVYESLVEQGFSTTGVTISDTAGLSVDNRVTGLLLTGGAHPRRLLQRLRDRIRPARTAYLGFQRNACQQVRGPDERGPGASQDRYPD